METLLAIILLIIILYFVYGISKEPEYNDSNILAFLVGIFCVIFWIYIIL